MEQSWNGGVPLVPSLVAANGADRLDKIALIVAILATAAAVGSLLYAGSADKRSRRALALAERADARESERHEADKSAKLVLDGFKLRQLDAEHFYATLYVRNVGGTTARDISVVLADEHLTPVGTRVPIAALEPRARSNQFSSTHRARWTSRSASLPRGWTRSARIPTCGSRRRPSHGGGNGRFDSCRDHLLFMQVCVARLSAE